jgi:hypothetical protein
MGLRLEYGSDIGGDRSTSLTVSSTNESSHVGSDGDGETIRKSLENGEQRDEEFGPHAGER